MKTLGHFSLKTAPLVVAVTLVLSAGGTYAAGPAGGGTVGGSTGAAGGPSAAGVSGAGFSGAGRGGASSARGVTGARSGVSFSNNGAARSFGNNGFARGNGVRGYGAPSSLSLPYHNVLNTGASPAASRFVAAPAVTRPANAWSSMAVAPANNGAGVRGTSRPAYRSNNWTADGFTGQRLDAGAPGSNLPTYNRGDRGGRNGYYRSRFPGRYYYYPYAYGPDYAPYISYFGGGYGGAYPYYNDVPAADTDYANSSAATVSPQYAEQAPASNDQPDAAQQPVPQRQEQSTANPGTIPGNGPDSLVEAVQEELVRRGYFGGKVDAMFSPETKEALRKFQSDHHLAATGLVNEATLHALQLD